MKSIEEIIEITGGWDRLRSHPLSIEVGGFVPLHIEIIGGGPRGCRPAVRNAHLPAERGRVPRPGRGD